MEFRSDRRYTVDHLWLLTEGDVARVGITDFAQDQLGEVLYVELPEVGAHLRRGETFGLVESAKVSVELEAPANGEVVESNIKLADSPWTLNDSPYDDGWLLRVRPEDEAELDGLLDSDTYRRQCEDG